MTESTYTVRGMTCGHCATSVTEEVSRIDGVREVGVDLDGGKVTVVGDGPVTEDAVRAAVAEAGYELVSG